jgi:hypothetical protein
MGSAQPHEDTADDRWTLLKKGDKLYVPTTFTLPLPMSLTHRSTLVPSNPFSIHFKDSPGPQL